MNSPDTTTQATEALTEVTVTRFIAAHPRAVFDAWVDPAKIVRWWAGDGRAVDVKQLQPWAGGAWRFAFTTPTGRCFEMSGRYRDFEPPHRLSFTWTSITDAQISAETMVLVDIQGNGDGCDVTVRHCLPAGTPELLTVRTGWEASTLRLRKLTQARWAEPLEEMMK